MQVPPPTGGRANPDIVRLSTGVLWHAGSIVPPPPVTYSCTLSPDSAYPGDPVTVTGSANNLNPKKTTTYSWIATNGATVSGNTSTGTITTASLNPGQLYGDRTRFGGDQAGTIRRLHGEFDGEAI